MKQPVAKKAVSALSKPSFEDYYKSIPEYKNDTVSYDLQSAYEELPYSQMKRFVESNAHLPDTYKKPTHPTFSNESKHHNDKTPGGYWDRDTKGRDRFTPSQYNIDNMGGPKEYMKWFQENEKGVILNMPYEQTQPTSFINNYFEDVVRAEKGLSLGFRTGEKWSVVEDLKGPSHADGGIDLFFNTDGLSFSRYGKTIKAEKGLIITNGVISGGDLSKLGARVRPSADANTSNAPTSTIQPVNPNVNTSLIGKTWDDIPTNNPAYNQPQLKQDTRTDYERQRDQEAMTAYQNPTILEQVFGGARMVTRAVADPIQGIGQVFDAVGLGDTRIGQDLGNFNDEEAQYRYRNLNPNIDAGEKFMSNLGEGSEVAAWGATNFIPFESSVINPIVKGLVGKGNYSSYLANQLYSPVVNQGVKEVVEGSVVKQVDDNIIPINNYLDDIPDEIILEDMLSGSPIDLTRNGIKNKVIKPNRNAIDIGNDLTLVNNPSRVVDEKSILGKHRSLKSIENKITKESIDLKSWQDGDNIYYYFSANMPSSRIKAGKAYLELEKHIPTGSIILENSSLSMDSFNNILKQIKNPKFESSVKGKINLNNMSIHNTVPFSEKKSAFTTMDRILFKTKEDANMSVIELNKLLKSNNLPEASVVEHTISNSFLDSSEKLIQDELLKNKIRYGIELPNIALKKLYTILGITSATAGAIGASQENK